MKKIALLNTFCDTPEKIEVIIENARILKSLGVDVMVNSPIHLDSEVVREFDFYFNSLYTSSDIESWHTTISCKFSIF